MSKQKLFLTGLFLAGVLGLSAQPRYNLDQMNREKLNRGVVAIRSGQQVMVSWRTLTSDAAGQPFDVYRDGKKLNKKPLTKGGTFFVDEQPSASDAVYEVRGGGRDGSYTLRADAPDGYIPIPIQRPDGGTTPDGRSYTYSANDASVGDVDGDGQYEIILKWDPSNAHDNAHDGFTGPVLFDCYRLEKEEEAVDLGAEDYFDSGALCFIEWPERIEGLLPDDTVRVDITAGDVESRTVKMTFPTA